MSTTCPHPSPPTASGHITDLSETTARLNQGQSRHDSLSQLAQHHQAQELGVQDEMAQALHAQNRAIAGRTARTESVEGQSQPLPELSEPHLILASPAGIESTTPQNTHQHSGGHTSVFAHVQLQERHQTHQRSQWHRIQSPGQKHPLPGQGLDHRQRRNRGQRRRQLHRMERQQDRRWHHRHLDGPSGKSPRAIADGTAVYVVPLGACRTLGVEAKSQLGEDSFVRFCRSIVDTMDPKSEQKWTVEVGLQPTFLKSDRLLDAQTSTDKNHAQNYPAFGSGPEWTDKGMVILRHTTKIGANGATPVQITFYSVYMHINALGKAPRC